MATRTEVFDAIETAAREEAAANVDYLHATGDESIRICWGTVPVHRDLLDDDLQEAAEEVGIDGGLVGEAYWAAYEDALPEGYHTEGDEGDGTVVHLVRVQEEEEVA